MALRALAAVFLLTSSATQAWAAQCGAEVCASGNPDPPGAAIFEDVDASGLLQVRAEQAAAAAAAGTLWPFDCGERWEFVPPIRRDVVNDGRVQKGFVLELKRGGEVVSFECVAESGGLITAFKRNGVNVIQDVASGEHGLYGSTFWTSPQSDWGWPPPSAFTDNYTAEVDEAAMKVVLVGPLEPPSQETKLGIQISKVFSVDLVRGGIKLEYVIKRVADGNVTMFAPWEITRIHPFGLTFWATGSSPSPSPGIAMADVGDRYRRDARLKGDFPPPQVTEAYGCTWYNHSDPKTTQNKLIANSSDSPHASSCRWLAHAEAMETGPNLVFLKQYASVDSVSAPGEGDVELFAWSLDGFPKYVEMENQGGYREIPVQKSLVWTVHWSLLPLPPNIEVAASQKLVDFVVQSKFPQCDQYVS